jgi:Cys-rich repeat protein
MLLLVLVALASLADTPECVEDDDCTSGAVCIAGTCLPNPGPTRPD